MNTDSTKPAVAPKPSPASHASPRPPAPHMSATRGPKPSPAPKPRAAPEAGGEQGRRLSGRRWVSSGEAAGEPEAEYPPDKMAAEEERTPFALRSPQNHGQEDGDVEEKEEEEKEASPKMEEDWRPSDSALTLVERWASSASGDAVDMADADLTEDMDAEGCGEALADADGVSMGDVWVGSGDEKKRWEEEEEEEGWSLSGDPCALVSDSEAQEADGSRNRRSAAFYPFGSLTEEAAGWECEDSGGSCENYVEIFRKHCGNGPSPDRTCEAGAPQGSSPSMAEELPADLDQPRIRPFSSLLSPSDSDLSDPEARTFLHVGEDPVRQEAAAGHASEGECGTRAAAGRSWSPQPQPGQRRFISGLDHPSVSSSPMLGPKQKNYAKPHYLSRYPRSISMEARDTCAGVYSCMDGPGRCSPSSSALDPSSIPPPFELAYITKRPITKSSPSLFAGDDASEKPRKKKSSIRHFFMLKFRRKTDGKPAADVGPSSSSDRPPDPDGPAGGGSPRPPSRRAAPRPPPALWLHQHSKGEGSAAAFLSRSVVRVESFEERWRPPVVPLPLTKPRSISFPNTDASDYENVPPVSSDYENLQAPRRTPPRPLPLPELFGRPARALTSAHETDGYVDMSGLPGFKAKPQPLDQEAESAYTEAYRVCLLAAAPQAASGDVRAEVRGEEDAGRTSDEEEGGAERSYEGRAGRSRAFYIAKELLDTERAHVKGLKHLQEDFREAVGAALGDEGEPVLDEDRLRGILNELPGVYALHRRILNQLESRLGRWDEQQRIADIFLSRKAEFLVFTAYIGHYDRSVSLLEDSCRSSPAFAAVLRRFERSPAAQNGPLEHQLLRVIVRVAQYRMILTDYLNNLSPDSREYEDTQAAVAAVSDIADQANDSLKDGENLLRLVNIEYSVRGQGELLQPGRVFVKEGTLMSVSSRSQQPRHLFLMNDVLLYTCPQQDGKYRLKNSLSLTGLKVSKPIVENVQNALRIEGTDISITLSASSFTEREDWFSTISRTVTEHSASSAAVSSCSSEARDRARLFLGEKAPPLVPVSQAMMCMNCSSDFSLTLRRHHCHSCGRIVCRSCSRNRHQLKYMKDRAANVCDRCYAELKKRADVAALSSQGSPRPLRSSRPLSAVFHNIHPPNIWRHRKGIVTLAQVTVSEEGSMSGSLQRSKKSKRSWKRLWFLLKDKVLYTYRAQEEKVASETLPLLGFTVKLPDGPPSEEEEASVFQLYHKNTLYYTFKAADTHTAQRWVNAMEEATVL